MAEQLGAGGRSNDAGPDWSQTARSSAAPAWATGQAGAGAASSAASATAVADAPTTSPAPPAAPPSPAAPPPEGFDEPSEDDEDLSTSGAVGQPVIETVLGGTVIAINDDPVG